MPNRVINLRSWIKNTTGLFLSSTLASLLNILSVGLITYAYGAKSLGAIGIALSFLMIWGGVFGCQPWKVLGHHCLIALEERNEEEFFKLIHFNIMMDLICALVALLTFIFLHQVVMDWLGLSRVVQQLILLGWPLILVNLISAPLMVLRALGGYRALAYQNLLISFLKMLLAFGVLSSGLALERYFGMVIAIMVLGLLHLAYSARKIIQGEFSGVGHTITSIFNVDIFKKYPEMKRFLWMANLQSTLKLITTELDNIVLGHAVGEYGVGVYSIFKRVGSVLGQLYYASDTVIYKQLSKIVMNREINLIFKKYLPVLFVQTTISVLYILLWSQCGKSILEKIGVVVSEFDQIGLYLYLVATAIITIFFPLGSSLSFLKNPNHSFFLSLIATALYFPMLFCCTQYWGVLGASLAYVFYAIVSTILIFMVIKLVKVETSYAVKI